MICNLFDKDNTLSISNISTTQQYHNFYLYYIILYIVTLLLMSILTEVVDSSYDLWYSYKLDKCTSTNSQPHTYLNNL